MAKKVNARAAAVLIGAGLLAAYASGAKDKKKNTLPDYVLWAQTAIVLIDPDVGTPVNDPMGNQAAQQDVEKALMNWGRLRLVMDPSQAELVIVVRKGTKAGGQPTIGGDPNDRPVIVQQTDTAIRIGAQQGHPADVTQPGKPEGPSLGAEVGPSDDTFSVYKGQVSAPLENAPVWRYTAKDGLHSPDVPAVIQFKKAVDEAVKQQQQKQKQQAAQKGRP